MRPSNHSAPKATVPTATVPTATRVVLARHGETVWHADNRYAGGSSDIDLTERGRAQAEQLADWCRTANPDAIFSSPVRRAVETAQICADAIGAELNLVDDLTEVDFGTAEGRTVAELVELDAGVVDRFRADPVACPFPGSEPPERAADRAARALREIAAAYPGGRVLVVAHNTVLRLGICALIGVPVSRYRVLFPRLDNAALTELAVPLDRDTFSALLSLNAPAEGGQARVGSARRGRSTSRSTPA